jgi:hypothetical protein
VHPQLSAVIAGFHAASARVRALDERARAGDWDRCPHPARWSVAECLRHLNLTSGAYVPLLRDAIARARALGRPAPRRYHRDVVGHAVWLLSGPLVRLAGFPIGRVATAAAFMPGGDLTRETVLAEFRRLQGEQVALAGEADGLPLDAVKVRSPFDERVRYSAWSALTILPRHQLRHILQAEEVLDTTGDARS